MSKTQYVQCGGNRMRKSARRTAPARRLRKKFKKDKTPVIDEETRCKEGAIISLSFGK
jgi:hypothetical protein